MKEIDSGVEERYPDASGLIIVMYTYILYSAGNDRYYIGHTNNIERRLQEHNDGASFSTAFYRPWLLVYAQEHQTRAEAMKRERYLKSLKSKIKIKEIIAG